MKAIDIRQGHVTATIEIPAESLMVIAAPPQMLSQRNVEAVLGIPARVFLQEIRAAGFPMPVMKLGKLRLVERAAFVAHLQSLASGPAPTPSLERPSAGAEASGIAAIIAEVGLEPIQTPSAGAGRRKKDPRARGAADESDRPRLCLSPSMSARDILK